LPDLVAASEEDYHRLVLRLATAPAELEARKTHLRDGLPQLPLADMKGFATALEDLYFRMWADACAGVRKPLLAA
jgi:predicted O-linked N-acetylglucosamine transferase (SPINDLY family)